MEPNAGVVYQVSNGCDAIAVPGPGTELVWSSVGDLVYGFTVDSERLHITVAQPEDRVSAVSIVYADPVEYNGRRFRMFAARLDEPFDQARVRVSLLDTATTNA